MANITYDLELANALENWQQAKQQLAKAKKLESELRIAICDQLLKDKEPGSHKYVVEDYLVVATRKITYNLDQKETFERYTSGSFTPEEESLLKLKFSLDLRAYKESKADLENFNELVTVKDAMPTLEIKE